MRTWYQRAISTSVPRFGLLGTWLVFIWATGAASAAVLHVNVQSANPVPPYTNWATAAVTIQDAVSAAEVGDRILVTNGIYKTGGLAVAGATGGGSGSNRVAVTKPVSVESVNGPAVTVIQAYPSPVTTAGVGAMRCVYLTNGASLSGFTLANGATWGPFGAGVWCQSSNLVVVSNCVLVGSFGSTRGAGAYGGTLLNCLLLSNTIPPVSSAGGGAWGSILVNCTLSRNSSREGGGAAFSALTNCTLTANTAQYGGGASASRLHNCLITGNSATNDGGGVYGGGIYNCTVSGNSAAIRGGGAAGAGGTGPTVMVNSIVYYNTAPDSPNYFAVTYSSCCTIPQGGSGFTNAPGFIDFAGGNFRLLSNSPCIDAGLSRSDTPTTDLDGRPRLVGSEVDLGAYEQQPDASGEFIGWLAGYALPTDGSGDHADADADGHNAWQEWRADTNPTNHASSLRLLAPAHETSGVHLRWESVGSRTYFLERAHEPGLTQAFELIQTNIAGLPGETSYTDTNAPGAPVSIYRVGVQ